MPLYVVSSSSKEELPEGELPNYSGREEEERFGQIKAAIDARRMGMVIDPSSCAENIRRAVAAGLSLADALVVIGQAHREWGPPVVARQLLAVAQGETITVAMPSAPAPPPETRPHYADIDEIRAVDKRASESGPLIGPERLREFRSAQCAPVACQNGHEEG